MKAASNSSGDELEKSESGGTCSEDDGCDSDLRSRYNTELNGTFQAAHVDASTPLPNIRVVAFSDEEGIRFGSTYLGSRALSGTFLARSYHQLRDEVGSTLLEVVEKLTGHPVSVEALGKLALDPGRVAAYTEVHTEQGRVLE